MEHLAGRGPHDRQAAAVRALARLPSAGLAWTAARLDHGATRDARAADPPPVRGRGRASMVAVPADPRPHELRGRLRGQRHHRRQLAAERLLVRPGRRRRPAERARNLDAARQLSSQPALLAADRGAPAGRRLGTRACACAATSSAARRTAWRQPLRPRVAPDPRRVHGARAAHRPSAAAGRPGAVPRLGRASAATGSISIPASAAPAISTSAAGPSRSRSAR